MSYFTHLIVNWVVAAHAVKDVVAHLLHGLIPIIKIKHHHMKGGAE